MLKRFLLILCIVALFGDGGEAAAASSEPVRLEHTTARLYTAYDRIAAQESFYVLLHLEIDPEWHTYWLNPGDSGLPTRMEWELPAGWSASEIVWQPPSRLPYGPLVNYGYSDDAYHLVRITPSADAKDGESAELKLHAQWLACREECVPESADLSVMIDLGEAMPSDTYEWIERLRDSADLPQVTGVAQRAAQGGTFTLEVALETQPEVGDITEAYFYSVTQGSVEPSAPQTLAKSADKLRLTVTEGAVALPVEAEGVLELHNAEDEVFHRWVKLEQGKLAAFSPAIAKTTDLVEYDGEPLLLTLLFAFIGGFILNAMPCVFPVLSLKALGLSKKSAKERKHVRAHGYAYTLGVIGSFALVGLVLIILKAAGGAVGWGYQMQSPYFVAGLTYMLFLIGLNLAGYFDITFHMSVGTRSGEKETLKGSFAMGALVTLVATPCTAPFMATALGAALVRPPVSGMTIFIAMGFGLALPYLLLTTVPGALKWMPKPGAWMERFKQFLAFPMFISVVWLVWVFSLQAGVDATAWLLLGLVTLTLAIWLGRGVTRQGGMKRLLLTVLLSALALGPLMALPSSIAKPGQMQSTEGIPKVAYNEEALALLREQGKPVFVYATAAWCITCKVNERAALNDESVQAYFVEKGIQVMVADWTSEDQNITRFLSQFGRAGVPLYVFFPADGGEPRILPQLLTPSKVIEDVS